MVGLDLPDAVATEIGDVEASMGVTSDDVDRSRHARNLDGVLTDVSFLCVVDDEGSAAPTGHVQVVAQDGGPFHPGTTDLDSVDVIDLVPCNVRFIC